MRFFFSVLGRWCMENTFSFWVGRGRRLMSVPVLGLHLGVMSFLFLCLLLVSGHVFS